MASPVLVFVYLSVSACVISSCRSLHIPSFRSNYAVPSYPSPFDSHRPYSMRKTFNDAASHYYGPPSIVNFDSDGFKKPLGFGRASSRRWARAFQNPRSVPETSHFLIIVPPTPGTHCPVGTLPDHSGQCRVPLNVFKPVDTPHTRIYTPSNVPELIPEDVPEMATANPITTTTSTTTTSSSITSTTPPSTFRAKSCTSTKNSTTTTGRSVLPEGVPLVSPAPTVASLPATDSSDQEPDVSVQNTECVESTVEGDGDAKVDGEGQVDASGEGDKGATDAPLPVLLLLRDMPSLLRLPVVEKLSGKHDRDLKKVLEKVGGEESLINNVIEE